MKIAQILKELSLPRLAGTDDRLRRMMANPRFKAWWRNSKVIDDDGLPLICYHYSKADEPFGLFQPFSHFGTKNAAFERWQDQTKGHIKYGKMSGGHTKFVLLSIQSPVEIEDNGLESAYHIGLELTKFGEITSEELVGIKFEPSRENSRSRIEYSKLQNLCSRRGIDGMFYKNEMEDKGSTSWIITRPIQAMPLFKLLKLADEPSSHQAPQKYARVA